MNNFLKFFILFLGIGAAGFLAGCDNSPTAQQGRNNMEKNRPYAIAIVDTNLVLWKVRDDTSGGDAYAYFTSRVEENSLPSIYPDQKDRAIMIAVTNDGVALFKVYDNTSGGLSFVNFSAQLREPLKKTSDNQKLFTDSVIIASAGGDNLYKNYDATSGGPYYSTFASGGTYWKRNCGKNCTERRFVSNAL